MRVAQRTIYETNRFNLGNLTERLSDANRVVGTGKRINTLSDDPVGLTQILNLKSNLSNLDQIKRNISTGRTWLNAGESALSSIRDLLTDAKCISIAMASGTANSAQRAGAAEQIKGILFQVQGLANTVVNGSYIFAGNKTDTMPFVFDDDQNPTTATYAGDSGGFTIKIGKDTTVAVGHNGQSVFQDIFDVLIDLKTDLETNDVGGISASMTRLDNHFDNMLSEISKVGAKVVRLDIRENVIADLDLSYKENRSNIEDADIIEAVTELKSAEIAYQAALSSAAKVLGLSLVNYM